MTNSEVTKEIEQLLEKNAALELMLALLMKEMVVPTKENMGRTIETVRLIDGNVGRMKRKRSVRWKRQRSATASPMGREDKTRGQMFKLILDKSVRPQEIISQLRILK
jgi:hypothetical protein